MTEEMVKTIKRLFDNMKKAFDELKLDLAHAFAIIDVSHDQAVEKSELKILIDKCKIEMTNHELDVLFEAIDIDGSGDISFPEFQMEYNRVVNTPIENLLAMHRSKQKGGDALVPHTSYLPANTEFLTSEDVKQGTKIAILEAKEKQLTRRSDMYQKRLKYLEEAETTWDR
jgi:hypothetical protein